MAEAELRAHSLILTEAEEQFFDRGRAEGKIEAETEAEALVGHWTTHHPRARELLIDPQSTLEETLVKHIRTSCIIYSE